MDTIDTNSWAVLVRLLEMAADEFSNHSCNDFNLPNTLENVALMTEVVSRNCEAEYLKLHGVELTLSKDGKYIFADDSELMDYFAHLARELAGIEE